MIISISMFSQNKLIELKIDSLITDDSNPKERKFILNYHIKNLTQKPISFLLNTKSIIPIVAGSGSIAPYYKLFEENSSIDVSGIFSTGNGKKSSLDSLFGSMTNKDSINKVFEKYIEKLRKSNKENLSKSMVKIDPSETKNYSFFLFWNKERYQKQDDNEYYLDEKAKHYLEISINLMKEELENKFTPEQFKNIIEDKTLIKGWFTSNKVEIDL